MLIFLRNLIRRLLISIRLLGMRKIWRMDIHPTALISYRAQLDKTYPAGIHIGEESYIASGTMILTHDYCRNIHTHTQIGRRCFIGYGVIILPGVKIGDEVIIGAGSVVTRFCSHY